MYELLPFVDEGSATLELTGERTTFVEELSVLW